MNLDNTLNSLLARFNVKLQRNRPRRDAVQLLLMKSRELGAETILDIGGNIGQFGLDVRKKGWSGPIVSFEPLSLPYAQLMANAQADTCGWVVPTPVALGATSGEAIINVSENIDSSSFLSITPRGIATAPAAAIKSSETVQIRTLDSMIESTWLAPFAMKIDTQGFELEVLKGAMETIRNTVVVMVEMSLTQLYCGGAQFVEVYSWLEQAGFRCIALPETFADTVSEEVLQVDGIFVRSPA